MNSYKTHRFEENPKEKEFVEKFQKEICKRNLLGNIIFADNKERRHLNNTEERIVISAIQWLGSPVGQSFLNQCGFHLKK